MSAAGLRESPRDVRCPRCNAEEGTPCYEAKRNLRNYHQDRWDAYRSAVRMRFALAEEIAEDVKLHGQGWVRWGPAGPERIDPRRVVLLEEPEPGFCTARLEGRACTKPAGHLEGDRWHDDGSVAWLAEVESDGGE